MWVRFFFFVWCREESVLIIENEKDRKWDVRMGSGDEYQVGPQRLCAVLLSISRSSATVAETFGLNTVWTSMKNVFEGWQECPTTWYVHCGTLSTHLNRRCWKTRCGRWPTATPCTTTSTCSKIKSFSMWAAALGSSLCLQPMPEPNMCTGWVACSCLASKQHCIRLYCHIITHA